MLPVIIALVALVGEAGLGLIQKTENQRVADISAYAAGLAYAAGGSTANLTASAQNIAALNGVSAELVSASVTASPRTSSKQAIAVTITSTENLLLAPIMGASSTLTVAAGAYAELETQAPACIVALSGSGTGVMIGGAATVSAPNCVVSSNAAVSVDCGSSISAQAVTYDTSAQPNQPCSGIATSTLRSAASSDPLAGNTGISGAVARVPTVAGMSSPSAPTVAAGGPIDFGLNPAATMLQAMTDGCVAGVFLTTWTVVCAQIPGAAYTFGNITVAPGITVNFNTGGSASTTYNFSGSINNAGSALNFGPGTYNIAQGIATGAASFTSFGNGNFNLGQATGNCKAGGSYSICNGNGASLTFAGPSSFVLSAGVYNAGGGTLTLGSGSTNSFAIGASSDGNAIYADAGSTTTLADATGSAAAFQLAGNVTVAGGTGTCLTFGAAAQHDINGYVSLAGGTLLGAGIYTATGYFSLGGTGAGDVTCNGVTVGVNAAGVTLVTAATSTPVAAPCYNTGFCVASGYNNVALTAPSAGPTAHLLMVGPATTANAAGANITGGASATSLTGIVYVPYGTVTLANTGAIGAGDCLAVVGASVSQSGGTTNASNCLSVNGSGVPMTVALVQ